MTELAFGSLQSDHLGYGRAGSQLLAALRRQGVTVHNLGLGEIQSPMCATACWFSFPTHARGWYESQYAACFTMWETNYLPESFRGVLDNYDLIIVPSEQNEELFSRWHPNVRFVPLAVDDRWQPTKRQEPDRYFRFLTAGSGERKGIDLAERAFHTCFPNGSWGDGPIPILQIKSQKSGPVASPRVEPILGRLSAEDELNLYAQAHVYVQPSRGEGFGMQPLQAIRQALPTILTDAHGHKAFSHLGMGLSTTMSEAGYFSAGEAGEWWEPSFDELCDWMVCCYENYDEVKRDAWDAALLSQRFTWDETALQFLDVFPEGQLEKPALLAPWRPLTQRLYRVRVDAAHDMDIAGIAHRFEPGRDYFEPADIKRLLFDNQWLDPSCVRDEDSGLTAEQVARLDTYASDKAFCPHCRQQLNSGILWTPPAEAAS